MLTTYYVGNIPCSPSDELSHYGVLGMKWGIRRYQNEDGTLTALGRQRVYADRKTLEDHVKKERERMYYDKDYRQNFKAPKNAKKHQRELALRLDSTKVYDADNPFESEVEAAWKKYSEDTKRLEKKYNNPIAKMSQKQKQEYQKAIDAATKELDKNSSRYFDFADTGISLAMDYVNSNIPPEARSWAIDFLAQRGNFYDD